MDKSRGIGRDIRMLATRSANRKGLESMGAGPVDIHVAIVVNLDSDHVMKDTIRI